MILSLALLVAQSGPIERHPGGQEQCKQRIEEAGALRHARINGHLSAQGIIIPESILPEKKV